MHARALHSCMRVQGTHARSTCASAICNAMSKVSLGCLLVHPGCLLHASWVPLWCLLGASWAPLWCLLGAPSVAHGCLLGAPQCLRGASWGLLGASWVPSGCLLGAPSVPPGCLLEASWVPPEWLLGGSWVTPGCLLGAFWGALGRPGASWVALILVAIILAICALRLSADICFL